SIWYKRCYRKYTNYDNYFLNDCFYAIELNRLKKAPPLIGIFPLTINEKGQYIKSTNYKLTSSEFNILIWSVVFVLFTIVNVTFYISIDHLLYMVLKYINNVYVTFINAVLEHTTGYKTKVIGKGLLVNITQMIIDNVNVIEINKIRLDFMKCRPIPIKPDNVGEWRIISIMLLSLLTSLLQSYILRLRHIIMDYYEPDQKRIRASQLYATIVSKRRINPKLKLLKTFFDNIPFSSCIQRLFKQNCYCRCCNTSYEKDDYENVYIAFNAFMKTCIVKIVKSKLKNKKYNIMNQK
ncbi:hypothetical protein A3Q56_06357, partial [Intoshia linei]